MGILLLLVIATATVFWQVRNFDFVMLDDNILVFDNKFYQPGSDESLVNVWRHPHEQLYMPLTYTVWAGIALIAQVTPDTTTNAEPLSSLSPFFDPGIFHSFNLLLHVFCVLLVFVILRTLIANDWCAAFGALLFGLHPLQVESVAWVTEMKGLLSAFLALAAIWLYLLFARSEPATESTLPEHSTEERRSISQLQRMLLYIAATAIFGLALLAKPSVVVVPLLTLTIDLILLRRAARKAIPPMLLWLALALPVMWMARAAQPVSEQLAPTWAKPLIALDALAFYIGKILWPFRLSPEYTRIPQVVLENGWAYWTWLLPAGIGLLIWLRKQDKYPFAAAAIFVITLLPVLGFVPFVFQYYSTVADRYVYLAMLGPALLLSWTLSRSTRPTAFMGATFVMIALAFLSFRQTQVWQDTDALFKHTLRVNPKAHFARNNTGLQLQNQGRLAEAEKLYREVIRQRPDLAEAYINLGGLLHQQGKNQEAVEMLLKAEEISSAFSSTYLNLGQVYFKMGEYKYALLAFERAARREPRNGSIQVKIAEIHLRQQNLDKALYHLDLAFKLAPNPQSFYLTVATMMTQLNYIQASIPFYVEALRLMPDAANLHNDLGVNLLRLGKVEQGRKAIQNALEIDPTYPTAHHSYGLLLVTTKQYAAAEKSFRQAIELDPQFTIAYTSLADVLVKQKKTTEARNALRQALKIDPDFKPAREMLKVIG